MFAAVGDVLCKILSTFFLLIILHADLVSDINDRLREKWTSLIRASKSRVQLQGITRIEAQLRLQGRGLGCNLSHASAFASGRRVCHERRARFNGVRLVHVCCGSWDMRLGCFKANTTGTLGITSFIVSSCSGGWNLMLI
jgi:hypothetical protein